MCGFGFSGFHVIEGARQIRVTLFNGESYDGTLVAVLRIEAPRDVLAPVSLGNSSNLKVGQHVYAIGNPF